MSVFPFWQSLESWNICAVVSFLIFCRITSPRKKSPQKKAKERQLGTNVKQNIVPSIFVTTLCQPAERIYDGNTFNFLIFPEFVNSCATLIIIWALLALFVLFWRPWAAVSTARDYFVASSAFRVWSVVPWLTTGPSDQIFDPLYPAGY